MIKKMILDKEIIQKKIERIAYEIYEHNTDEPEIILAGIVDRGDILARKIAKTLHNIAPFRVILLDIFLDKLRPVEIRLSQEMDFNDRVIVVVDDVAMSGKTLLYAMKPFLQYFPKKIQSAVLVDRNHKSYPVSPDFIGQSVSTALQDMILVDVGEEEIECAYLIYP